MKIKMSSYSAIFYLKCLLFYWTWINDTRILKCAINKFQALPIYLRSDISNTRDTVSSYFQTPRMEMKIRRAAEYFWWNSRCLEMWWNTIFGVFDISSQSKQKLRSKRRHKIVKSMLTKTGYPNLRHGYDFICFNLMNY